MRAVILSVYLLLFFALLGQGQTLYLTQESGEKIEIPVENGQFHLEKSVSGEYIIKQHIDANVNQKQYLIKRVLHSSEVYLDASIALSSDKLIVQKTVDQIQYELNGFIQSNFEFYDYHLDGDYPTYSENITELLDLWVGTKFKKVKKNRANASLNKALFQINKEAVLVAMKEELQVLEILRISKIEVFGEPVSQEVKNEGGLITGFDALSPTDFDLNVVHDIGSLQQFDIELSNSFVDNYQQEFKAAPVPDNEMMARILTMIEQNAARLDKMEQLLKTKDVGGTNVSVEQVNKWLETSALKKELEEIKRLLETMVEKQGLTNDFDEDLISHSSVNYQIIAGSFKRYNNAVRYQSKLINKGYDASVLDETQGFFRVSCGETKSKSNAFALLKKVKQSENATAWIYPDRKGYFYSSVVKAN